MHHDLVENVNQVNTISLISPCDVIDTGENKYYFVFESTNHDQIENLIKKNCQEDVYDLSKNTMVTNLTSHGTHISRSGYPRGHSFFSDEESIITEFESWLLKTYFSFLCLAISAPRSPPSQNSITM